VKITEQIKESKSSREETSERLKNLKILEDLKSQINSVDEELSEYLKCDPEKFEANVKNAKLHLDACEMVNYKKILSNKFINKLVERQHLSSSEME